jgi:hypothetical protein
MAIDRRRRARIRVHQLLDGMLPNVAMRGIRRSPGDTQPRPQTQAGPHAGPRAGAQTPKNR